jgi:uroporphyrinogen-III decarboxylase
MEPRERFIAALERRPLTGRVPHFELVFFLTMEAFGKVHPTHRNYAQWVQMEERERQLHRVDMADLYVATAERYEHSAIFLHPNPDDVEETERLVDLIREKSGDRVCLIGNVDCRLLDTGTEEEVVESARYALQHGMVGGGYVFSTSNCIYTGIRLSRYELMLDVWRREGNYDAVDSPGS